MKGPSPAGAFHIIIVLGTFTLASLLNAPEEYTPVIAAGAAILSIPIPDTATALANRINKAAKRKNRLPGKTGPLDPNQQGE